MLNPFAIEKDILNKVAAIKKVVNTIKETVGSKIIQKASRYNFDIDEDVLNQCTAVIAQSAVKSKSYVCKICKKAFNDGRKLGGHVSRAHKQGEQQVSQLQSQKQFDEYQKKMVFPKPKRKSTRQKKSFLKEFDYKIRQPQEPYSLVMYDVKNTNEKKKEDLYFSPSEEN